ncbi:BID domain-containing T4SS effector [Bartonella sp. B41]
MKKTKSKIHVRPSSYSVSPAREGRTYEGIYKGSGLGSVVVELASSYVVCDEDWFTPEQLKSFKAGLCISFTVPTAQEVRETLIPSEKIKPLTKEEILKLLQEDAGVRASREKVRELSKTVYGHSSTLDEKLRALNKDPELSGQFFNQILKNPQSISSLAGVQLFSKKSQTRIDAEASVMPLCLSLAGYANAVRHAEGAITLEHKEQQYRKEQVVKMPSKDLQALLSSPKDKQEEKLSTSISLQKELASFMSQLQSRLSAGEKSAIERNDYRGLAASIGTSGSKAEKIVNLFQKAQEACSLVQIVKVAAKAPEVSPQEIRAPLEATQAACQEVRVSSETVVRPRRAPPPVPSRPSAQESLCETPHVVLRTVKDPLREAPQAAPRTVKVPLREAPQAAPRTVKDPLREALQAAPRTVKAPLREAPQAAPRTVKAPLREAPKVAPRTVKAPLREAPQAAPPRVAMVPPRAVHPVSSRSTGGPHRAPPPVPVRSVSTSPDVLKSFPSVGRSSSDIKASLCSVKASLGVVKVSPEAVKAHSDAVLRVPSGGSRIAQSRAHRPKTIAMAS